MNIGLTLNDLLLNLDLQLRLDSVDYQSGTPERLARRTNMSNGYTNALAATAPVAPAIALPHGGKGTTFAGGADMCLCYCSQTPSARCR